MDAKRQKRTVNENSPVILVVDDDKGISTLMQNHLHNAGFKTFWAETCTEALAWLRNNEVDLMLLDHKLPDMTGRQMVELLIAKKQTVPFIIVTGQGDDRLAVDMMKSGARDYIIKDTTFLELLPSVVEQVVKELRQEKKLTQAEKTLRKAHEELEKRVKNRTTELAKANEVLQAEIVERKRLEKELMDVSEREKRLIGQELHDSLGQQLMGIAFMAKVLERKLSAKKYEETKYAEEIVRLVNHAMEQARGMAKGLHPVDLEANNLVSALQQLALTTRNLFEVNCDFKYEKSELIKDTSVAVHVYRIAQEAITNAVRHGQAKNIHIELICDESENVLIVKNDGLYFPKVIPSKKGMGLRIMEHRSEVIGGSLEIRKGDGKGTVLKCVFPNKGPQN